MKRIIHSLLVVCSCVATYAQKKTSIPVAPFQEMKIWGSVSVYMLASQNDSALIESDDSAMVSKLSVRVEDGVLQISATKKYFSKHRKIRINIGKQRLKSVRAFAGAEFSSKDTVVCISLAIEAGSGAKIYFPVKADTLTCATDEGSTVSLEGKVNFLKASSATGALLNAFMLHANAATVNVNTGGVAKIRVLQSLEAHASTGGDIIYLGAPQHVVEKTSLAGTITKAIDE